jgi:hypothetical protein
MARIRRSDEEVEVSRGADCSTLRPTCSSAPDVDVCPQPAACEATYFMRNKRCGTLGQSEPYPLDQMRHENTRLKREVTNLILHRQSNAVVAAMKVASASIASG